MPATASGSSQVTCTQADHAASLASSGRPFRVGSDGLPLLPCHDAPVDVAYVTEPMPPAVSHFGHVDSTEDVRKQLIALYSRTQQLQHMSEMTLRIDTELELLRRRCFAQRNSQWDNVTPDQFEFKPTPSDMWTPQPANEKLLLRKLKMDGVLDGSGKQFYPPDKKQEADVLEYVRDRPWPPAEFALKPVVKPSRGRSGKRKAATMGAVLDPVPVLAKTCRECKTQSTPLWRSQSRTIKVKTMFPNLAANLANAFVAQNMASIALPKTEGKMMEIEQQTKVDLCLECYLKLERADLFDKKRAEKKRGERRKKDLEKKKIKQHVPVPKKQQKKEHRKQELLQAATGDQVTEQVSGTPAEVILKFTKEEIEAATGSSNEKKKDRKRSRKEKKKKRHRQNRDQHEDSVGDELTPSPSPTQINEYMYEGRASDSYATAHTSELEVNRASSSKHGKTAVKPEVLDDDLYKIKEDEEFTVSRSSSRKRKSVQRTEPVVLDELPSTLKKRKTSSSRSHGLKQSSSSAPPAPALVPVPPVSSVKKRSRSRRELARERELRALGQYCPVCNEVYEDDDQDTFVCCDSCELWVHGACDPSLTQYVLVMSLSTLHLNINACYLFGREIIAAMANTEEKYICPLCAGR
ncbi:hypothetical protein PsorP6_013776 [Peronosclerospora sorghi]|uniref:Uncharacterized protein n=1 Tax=Peronosclerospora sorghi TaxID=230839 RepID=A0ACC0VFB6_9STRA|nr:hypothetical protein PsorP6_013776 [Peronosclerospora sorghi]